MDARVLDGDSANLRSWLLKTGIPVLPYFDGSSRFGPKPCILPLRRMNALKEAAREISSCYNEFCKILARNPQILKNFFSLSPLQEMLWYASGAQWLGVSRADIFFTTEGTLRIAEVNSDTPSGVDEAYLLGRYAEESTAGGEFLNPNKHLPEMIRTVVSHALSELDVPTEVPTIGIVYPTDIPEDMGLINLYRSWLEGSGYRVVIGSPWNLVRRDNGRVALFDVEIDLLVRHYKSDWFCERLPVWKDAPVAPDSGPMKSVLEIIMEPMLEGKLAVVNPFGVITTQNKLSLAFFHEHIALFSPKTQESIRRLIPLSLRLTQSDHERLIDDREHWVLKSDYGCEGTEVIIGKNTTDEIWKTSLDLAVPERWIAQEYFDAEEKEDGVNENYGVYLAGGEPGGVYLRSSSGMTNNSSIITPVLVRAPRSLHSSTTRMKHHDTPDVPDVRVRRLLEAYTPGERWLPFRMNLLCYSASDPEAISPFKESKSTKAAAAAGVELSKLLGSANASLSESIVIISDLDGAESIAFSAALAGTANIVLQLENVASPSEVVGLRETLGALLELAPKVAGDSIRRQRRSTRDDGPAVFVLDHRRMAPLIDPLRQFNNRHWAYMPSVASLAERGITTVLYVTAGRQESDDLNEDFLKYHESGIRVCSVSPGAILSSREVTLESFLTSRESTPSRRRTIFSGGDNLASNTLPAVSESIT